MGLASKPNAVLNPSASELIGKAENVVTPTAVGAMSDAFRNGYITAADIMERTSERARAQEKADVTTAKLKQKQAEDAIGNQALAMASQKAAQEMQVAKGLLGANGDTVEAAYRSIGRLIPMTESQSLKGVKVPDIAKIDTELPKINAYLAEQQRRQLEQSGWEPATIVKEGAMGKKKTYTGFVNKFTGDTNGTIPMPTREPFEQWMQRQAQPGQVVPATTSAPIVTPGAAPVSAVAPAAPVAQPIVQPVTGPSGFRLTETAEADPTQVVNSVATHYNSNKVVQDALIAGTAYVGTKDVLDQIQADGSYSPAVKLPKQADYKLMVGYAKILDPNSVVREGEIYLLQGTASKWQNIANASNDQTFKDYISTLLGQQMFTKQERKSFAGLLTASYANRLEAARPIYQQNVDYLESVGASPEAVAAALPWPENSPAATPAPVGGSYTGSPGGPVSFSIPLSSGKIVDYDANRRPIGVRQPGATNAAPVSAVQRKRG